MLLARRFTHTSWPLQSAHLDLVGAAVALYFASYVFRALGWQKLFPAAERPDRARCLAACGASAASGAVLPFRLDYVVKIGTLRKMRGVKLGLEAIALSIISLGLVDSIAFLPLSISATATSSSGFRIPLMLVVLFGVGACGLLVGGRHLVRLPFIARRARLARIAERIAGSPARIGARTDHRLVLPARLLVVARVRQHAAAGGARESASRRRSRSSFSASRPRPR